MDAAKIDNNIVTDGAPFSIKINDDTYKFSGMTVMEGLGTAIDKHIDSDREFAEYITLIANGKSIRRFYAPGMLCGLGYLERSSLFELLVGNAMDEEDNEEGANALSGTTHVHGRTSGGSPRCLHD